MQIITYTQTDGTQAVMVPSPEALAQLSIEQIAAKDVPAGAEWEIVDGDDLTQIEPPPPYNPNAFKVGLMSDPLWNAWEDTLETVANRARENLKLAAIADDWATVQGLYNLVAAAVPPPEGAIAQWQALADANSIPLTFETS